MAKIRMALLDMNNNKANQGFRNIKEISEAFQQSITEKVEITTYDVRHKNEIPEVQNYDIFISSGGPGNPHREGKAWENRFSSFLEEIYTHNKTNDNKKYLFLICHSFQLAAIHWKIGNICKRKSYSFGIMPIYKTDEGESEVILKNLADPFYAVDSRAYQLIEPDYEKTQEMNMKIIALEKPRPHIDLERAVMAVRFSDEIFGTQFHPEADPQGMIENLKIKKNREAMIESFGMEKYLQTVDRINDDDKIKLTRSQILPTFLAIAKEAILKRNII